MIEYETTRRTITDSYEAAYYLMHGATISDVTTRRVSPKKELRLGFHTLWVIHMEGVPFSCIRKWKAHAATENVRAFVSSRIKLKKKVKEILNTKQYD